MRLDKLTTKSQEALEAAQELAHQHSQQQVDGEHLALALARQQDGIIPTLLQRIGVDLAQLQAESATHCSSLGKWKIWGGWGGGDLLL